MPDIFVFAAIVTLAAAVGVRFKPDPWYRKLRMPAWNPPDRVFVPVWTIIYAGITFAGWLVWRDAGTVWTVALVLWALQLAFDVVWSWLYFDRHNIGGALVDCVLLLVTIVAFIVVAAPINATAALLFVPYGLWVAFTTLLTGAIWRMNREHDSQRDSFAQMRGS